MNNDAKSHIERGNAHHAAGEHDCAIASYTKAIELDPGEAGTYQKRGNAYSENGDFDCAIKDYDKAIELNPRYAGAYFNLCNIYMAKNERGLAIENFNKAIELDSPRIFVLCEIYLAKPRSHRLKSAENSALRPTNRVDAAIEEEFKNIPFHIRLMGGFRGSRDTYNRYVKNYNKMVFIISTAVAEGDITREEGRFVLNQCRK